MLLAVTIDVEEEGLFGGAYAANNVRATNVQRLTALDRVFSEFAIRPTLLVTYQAARDPANQELLLKLRDQWKGEIGCHLHHWNTPPLEPLPYAEPVPSGLMPESLLAAKLNTLLDVLAGMGVEPVSFRMGRFNMGPKMFSVLEQSPIRVDTSIAPMRKYYGGPEQLWAPTDPYFPDPDNPYVPGGSHILELPMTILPVTPGLAVILERFSRLGPRADSMASWVAKYVASLPAQPLWTGLERLKTAVRLHRKRRGECLTIFFHSSELMPGASPENRTEDDVKRFLERLAAFFAWLRDDIHVESLTLSEIAARYAGRAPRAEWGQTRD
ncbi:MAG: hypothetical protein HY914_02975 [Desulfomonile tiedjei]|nr:hypothetical protein [Desulfomonile tiedjei]